MSGILGILQLNGATVSSADLDAMASLLVRRGPDRTGLWTDGPMGTGCTLLTTTPELAREPQPVCHRASGCVITADVRLDNREELLAILNLVDRAAALGDAGLILEAYLAWGEECAERLLGDFAFAIWDPRRRTVFGVRDQCGMRPFYYHHTPSKHFVWASEPRAILVLPQVPYRINEERIADFMVGTQPQWINYTDTFFEDVFRLPAGHAITVSDRGIRVRRYWVLEPGTPLRFDSDEAYAEALRDVLTTAVRARLRASGPVGATLSGGLDSGSVVAIAKDLWHADHGTPLSTFSAVGPDPTGDPETRAIHSVIGVPGLAPQLIDYTRLDAVMPDLEERSWDVDEPYDFEMAILLSLWLAARRHGIRVVLDGGAGDVVLGWGTHIVRLFRQGRWLEACRTGVGLDRVHGAAVPGGSVARALGAALTPDVIRPVLHRLRDRALVARASQSAFISKDFVRRMARSARYRRDGGHRLGGYHQERAAGVLRDVVYGREVYGRIAAGIGMEARDPFMDRRVVSFCVNLPGDQCIGGGWPKVVLRRAMIGRLPDCVTWGRRQPHLGGFFATAAFRDRACGAPVLEGPIRHLSAPFLNIAALEDACREHRARAPQNFVAPWPIYKSLALAHWLDRTAQRPTSLSNAARPL